MSDLQAQLLELIRLTATSLPPDVETALQDAAEWEDEASTARNVLQTMLRNAAIARANSTPICQDTGTPIFYVEYPQSYSTLELKAIIRAAVSEATEKNYLRPNAVDSLTGRNSGDNLGDAYFPEFHFEEHTGSDLRITLLLKGGGCENVGCQYALPDARLKADRDLEGVRKAALDAVFQAQGRGCAPGFLGIAIGGDRSTSFAASKEVFLEKIGEHHIDPEIATLEARITREANQLDIGPMGMGGHTTVLGTRITQLHRLPASYFVSVSYMCWAFRRRSLTLAYGKAIYD
ncbi:fumarate hydratase [Pelolinea submarina]|uniref:Fumarate hydratase class I n=1 Tax=Pelolinea submarina TaxID=913107 RepID=A0A347ZQN7_9CHLR|nr:fumarate hydratase [Pelolinea submarina]REG11826.1 fumarate hydratase class I [Pelolinea submarina]BBB47618.1 fumarate hydratase, class I [Pelolinea submarina]